MTDPDPERKPIVLSAARQKKLAETGIACAKCGCRHWTVAKTVPHSTGVIRRYRVCRHCGHRRRTVEQPG